MEIIKDLPEIFDEFEDKKKQSFLKVKEYKEKISKLNGEVIAMIRVKD